MLSRRSLLGSLVKSLLAAGVMVAPLATIVVTSEVEAEQTQSGSTTFVVPHKHRRRGIWRRRTPRHKR
jgi:hypothetical protein